MVQSQTGTPEIVDPHKEYKSLTAKITSEDDQNLALGLEDTMYRAWAAHTGQNKDAQGKDLAGKVYEAAKGYIIDTMFPAYKGIKGNDLSKDVLENTIEQLVGINQNDLEKKLKDKKVVHRADLASDVNQSQEGISKYLQSIRIGKAQKFATENIDGFKGYLKTLASEAKVTDFNADTIVGPKTATAAYLRLINRIRQYKGLDKTSKFEIGTIEE